MIASELRERSDLVTLTDSADPALEGAVIAQIVQDQRGSAPNDVSETVAELQRIADSSEAGPATTSVNWPAAHHVRRRQLVAVARN
jgi:hypothetical protein